MTEFVWTLATGSVIILGIWIVLAMLVAVWLRENEWGEN